MLYANWLRIDKVIVKIKSTVQFLSKADLQSYVHGTPSTAVFSKHVIIQHKTWPAV